MINFHAILPHGQPENYPFKLAGEALDFCAVAAVTARARIYRKPWVAFLVTDPEIGTVGGCGFLNMPVDDRVEISWQCFDGFTGRGYEAAMIRALILIAHKAAAKITLYAHSPPIEDEETLILEQCGFDYIGMVEHEERGLMWLWERAA